MNARNSAFHSRDNLEAALRMLVAGLNSTSINDVRFDAKRIILDVMIQEWNETQATEYELRGFGGHFSLHNVVFRPTTDSSTAARLAFLDSLDFGDLPADVHSELIANAIIGLHGGTWDVIRSALPEAKDYDSSKSVASLIRLTLKICG